MNFLSHRAAIGSRISSLKIWDHRHMDEDVIERIRCMVDVFEERLDPSLDADPYLVAIAT